MIYRTNKVLVTLIAQKPIRLKKKLKTKTPYFDSFCLVLPVYYGIRSYNWDYGILTQNSEAYYIVIPSHPSTCTNLMLYAKFLHTKESQPSDLISG